jgi:hypothetical protein
MPRNSGGRELTMRSQRRGNRLRRGGPIAIPMVVLMLTSLSAAAQNSCPLTDAQSQKSIDAWAKIAAFLTSEPRCANCHGRVNPYIDDVGLDPDDPNKDPLAPVSQIGHVPRGQKHEQTGIMDQGCKDCHNGMAPKGVWVEKGDPVPEPPPEGTPLSNWTTATFGHSFVDKDATTLCRQIKQATHSADEFLGHLKNDNGGTNFAGTAFLGNRGLAADTLRDFHVTVQPPSITHSEVMKLAQDWIDAMGGSFQGDEGCGCELRHSLWSGQIRFARQDSGDEGDFPDQQWSNRSLVSVVVTVANGVGTYHGRVERKSFGKNWQPVANAPHREDTSSSNEESGDGTAAATVEVRIDEARGTYSIQVGSVITPDGRSSWPTKIGEAHWTTCNRTSGCQSGTRDVGMPTIELTGPLSGRIRDPNHIQESLYAPPKTQQGRSRKGVTIQMTSVDLWRSGSN